jgi:hypothetical protein
VAAALRYSFDIKQGKVVKEVGVDAKPGKVLENAKEGPNPDWISSRHGWEIAQP